MTDAAPQQPTPLDACIAELAALLPAQRLPAALSMVSGKRYDAATVAQAMRQVKHAAPVRAAEQAAQSALRASRARRKE